MSKEMTFLEHLEELRWHLIRALIAMILASFIVFFFPKFLFDTVLLGPTRSDFITFKTFCSLGKSLGFSGFCIEKMPFVIQVRKLADQFTYHIIGSVVAGLIVAFPYVFWEIWRFIKPGLHEHEQKQSAGAVFFVSLLFFSGVAFGYFLITPISINFLVNYKVSDIVINEIDLASVASTVIMLTLFSGVMFQLPIVVFFLTKTGLVSPKILKSYRRYAFIIILIISAIITPPDVFSQLLVALPVYLLFEVSISISAWTQKNQEPLQEYEPLHRDENITIKASDNSIGRR
jgi:sec-independent protein translocase protein TatC